jgi:hypothetical protein
VAVCLKALFGSWHDGRSCVIGVGINGAALSSCAFFQMALDIGARCVFHCLVQYAAGRALAGI